MGTVFSGFSGPVAAVFLLAENRLLREALLRILSKKDEIQVAGAGSYGPDMLEQIVSTRANVVVLDSVSPVLAEPSVVRELHRRSPAIRVVMVGMEADEARFPPRRPGWRRRLRAQRRFGGRGGANHSRGGRR